MTFIWGRDYRGELDPTVRERASRDWPGVGGLEAWIAGRRWKTVPGGWIITGEPEQLAAFSMLALPRRGTSQNVRSSPDAVANGEEETHHTEPKRRA